MAKPFNPKTDECPRVRRDPDAHIAIVAHRRAGWAVTHLEGPGVLLVNGAPVGFGAHLLVDGDLVEIAGALLQFRLDR